MIGSSEAYRNRLGRRTQQVMVSFAYKLLPIGHDYETNIARIRIYAGQLLKCCADHMIQYFMKGKALDSVHSTGAMNSNRKTQAHCGLKSDYTKRIHIMSY